MIRGRFKLFWIILLGIFINNSSFSQNYKLKWGEELKMPRLSVMLKTLGQDEKNNFYVLSGKQFVGWGGRTGLLGMGANRIGAGGNLFRANQVSIIKLRNGIQPILQQKIDIELAGKPLDVIFAFLSNGNIYLFSSFLNAKTKLEHIFVQTIDKENLTIQDDIRKVCSIPFEDKYMSGNLNVKFSRDSSHVLLFASEQSKNREKEKFEFFVFDQDMKLKWSKSVTIPVKEKDFLIVGYVVDNDGNVYLSGKNYEEPAKLNNKDLQYHYVVKAYGNDGEKESEYKLDLNDRFLSNLHLEISPKGDLVCSGFYSEKANSGAKGTFYLTMDINTQKVQKASLKEFGMDFILEGLSEKSRRKILNKAANGKETGLHNFYIRDLIPRADGGAVLTAEQYVVSHFTTTDARTGFVKETSRYYYNDIIVVSISSRGDIEWTSKIPKFQVSLNDGGYYSSYSTMITPDKIYFLYNDHKNNSQASYKNGVVVIVSVDHKGKVEKKNLFDSETTGTTFLPRLSKQVSSNKVLLYGKKGKRRQFGELIFY